MDIEKKIVEYFSNMSHIAAVYLFGSAIRVGFELAEDIDIAVLFETEGIPDGFRRIEMQENLSDYLKKEVDLVVLNSAPVILRYQVLKKGKLLILKNRKVKNEFFVSTLNQYFDLKQIRMPIEKKLVKVNLFGRF
ncbi:MAG: type VII toxin-antitoxin system MntA family adenylyltransferase antitoxin [Candidatus Kryptoniota bacterium]